ncbi:mCG145549, partial [Mus musculus]
EGLHRLLEVTVSMLRFRTGKLLRPDVLAIQGHLLKGCRPPLNLSMWASRSGKGTPVLTSAILPPEGRGGRQPQPGSPGASSLATGLCQDQSFRRRVPAGWTIPFPPPILLTSKQCLRISRVQGDPMSKQLWGRERPSSRAQ